MQRRDLTQALLTGVGAAALTSARNATADSCAASCTPITPMEKAADIPVPRPEYPSGDVRRYGAVANTPGSAAIDNTEIVQRIFNMFRKYGGKIEFPGGDWSFFLDVSTASAHAELPVVIEGNGAVLRCFKSSPTASCIVYANNFHKSSAFVGSNLQFRDCNFIGRLYGSETPGDVDYTVQFTGTSAVFYGCSFQYGRVAGFYALYGQYTEFWSCMFGACTATPASSGCLLDSAAAAASTNEVLFSRCKFFSCSNFLVLKGCFLTRIRDSTFQGAPGGGRGGIVIEADSTGQGSFGTIIDGCWFEINRVPHILGRVCQATRLHANNFYASGGINRIVFDFCYDLEVLNNNAYEQVDCRISHPAADTLTAALSWIGNNFAPVLAIDHNGPAYLDVRTASARTVRNDNLLITTGQSGARQLPLVQSDQHGFRTAIPRGAVTPIFRVNLEAFEAAPYMPVLLLDIQLFAWEDTADPANYGACGRAQRFYAFITSNGGKLAAYVSAMVDGADMGGDPRVVSLGTLSLFASSAGSVASKNAAVTFAVSFPGGGADSSRVASASVGYKLAAAGGNPFTLTRL